MKHPVLPSAARRAFTHLPPVARRDRTIARLREREERLRNELDQAKLQRQQWKERANKDTVREPAFMTSLWQSRRASELIQSHPDKQHHPRWRIAHKLRNYALAASHGIQVPQIHGVWPDLESVDWQELPDQFVLKANTGARARGVAPLTRTPEGYRLVTTPRHLTSEQVQETLRPHRGVSPPWFAEELLTDVRQGPPRGEREAAESLPNDVKMYCFYGRVGHVMVRHVNSHDDQGATQLRYLDAHGLDIDVSAKNASDHTVPLPTHFHEMVAVAEMISTVHAVPFIRVDLYSTPAGVVLGELTAKPGGNHGFASDHERVLGHLWEQAQVQLDIDVASGARPLGPSVGKHPVPSLLRPYLPAG